MIEATSQPAGYVIDNTDCDDTTAAANPDQAEVYDGIDNNCDGNVDEGAATYYRDADSDGCGNPADSIVSIGEPAGYVNNDADCDDSNGDVNPVAIEVSDGIDNDCDGSVDE